MSLPEFYVIHNQTCDVCLNRLPIGVAIYDNGYSSPPTLNACLDCLHDMLAKIQEGL